jgi:hypothetical protein
MSIYGPYLIVAAYVVAVVVVIAVVWEGALLLPRRGRVVARVLVLLAVAVWVAGVVRTGWSSFEQLGGRQFCGLGAGRCVEFLLANGERIDVWNPVQPVVQLVFDWAEGTPRP